MLDPNLYIHIYDPRHFLDTFGTSICLCCLLHSVILKKLHQFIKIMLNPKRNIVLVHGISKPSLVYGFCKQIQYTQ